MDYLNLKPGDHLCCLYETEEEHRAVLETMPTCGRVSLTRTG